MKRDKDIRYDPQTGKPIVTERGEGDRLVEPVIIKKRAGFGAWLGGAVFGAVLLAAAYAYFAGQQGSYQNAGAAVDQKVVQAERTADAAAEDAGDAAKDAGDRIESATDRAAP